MPELTATTSDLTQVTDQLACYLQLDAPNSAAPFSLTPTFAFEYSAQQYNYVLPSGTLHLLKVILNLPQSMPEIEIEHTRKSAIKSALVWHKRRLLQDKESQATIYYVVTLDIHLFAAADAHSNQIPKNNIKSAPHLAHSFGARYFMEELVIDVNANMPVLQIFSWQDWQAIIATLQTPCDLWQFLRYHLEQLQQSSASGHASFDNEQALLTPFMSSEYVFTQALAIDNALIKYAIQDKPNSALITMSLAQRHNSVTAQMYQQHMQQAAILWAQLSTQMLEMHAHDPVHNSANNGSGKAAARFLQWQQQLLDESLFSRHELVRTLYQHRKQTLAMQESGYVVHQHSYANLGRHYVLIFYGHKTDSKQSKSVIQPNLQQIAQDVATRLPLTELHHVVVLGIEFVEDNEETFIDIDVWIQPVMAMTQKERQLTKQLQRFNQQQNDSQKYQHSQKEKVTIKTDFPQLKLNLSVPVRNHKA